ncbi:ubiquitin fusion degradation protein 1 homolog [Panonychus citri]|uniref:ubiquitin fusion degradation protein 1 homolog n=1 Tax=Panonychus citri TaxID=50023 RepID=UPI0023072FD8|nr:ubiquitin fusion degradation protein 1 homolog [Panonychus citri]
MFNFNINMFNEPLRPFSTVYKCFSVSMLPGSERQDVERGGKIIMPPSALDHLTRLNIVYPMLFKLTNVATNRVTHSGVLEFVADEGKVYLPYWMMRNLLLDEGSLIRVESTSLPVATFSKFQPQSVDFLDITNPKAVLENALRNFACLTSGDVIAIVYNDKVFELCVLETKPGPAVTIIECDMNVEFAPPVGYRDPSEMANEKNDLEDINAMIEHQEDQELAGKYIDAFIAFSGKGNRLDGKQKTSPQATEVKPKAQIMRGIPDYDFQLGTLKFKRNVRKESDKKDKENLAEKAFEAFGGEGRTLIKKK